MDKIKHLNLKVNKEKVKNKKLLNVYERLLNDFDNFQRKSVDRPVYEVMNETNKRVLQLMRMKDIIEPDVKINLNKHPKTDITYLQVKGYWIENDGSKTRKFSKLIGRLDNYEDRNDPRVLEDGTDVLQKVMFKKFVEEYGEPI